jgi:hypothetical protein
MSRDNEQKWTTVARSKEKKQEVRHLAEQLAMKQAHKHQKREATRARKMEAREQHEESASLVLLPACTSKTSPLVILNVVPRICTLSDVIRDLKAYLVNRAASSNNAMFTVRYLCESDDLFYKRNTIMKALRELLSCGFLLLHASDGEELFAIAPKSLAEILICGRAGEAHAASSPDMNVAFPATASASSADVGASSVHTSQLTTSRPNACNSYATTCLECPEKHATHVVSRGPGSTTKYGHLVPATAIGYSYDGAPAFKWHDIEAFRHFKIVD